MIRRHFEYLVSGFLYAPIIQNKFKAIIKKHTQYRQGLIKVKLRRKTKLNLNLKEKAKFKKQLKSVRVKLKKAALRNLQI